MMTKLVQNKIIRLLNRNNNKINKIKYLKRGSTRVKKKK